jgi:hypothetical protein
MLAARTLNRTLEAVALLCLATGCEEVWQKIGGHSLSRGRNQEDEIAANAPPPDGPKLGILADLTPVYDEPDRDSRRIGWLHAGAQVSRAAKSTSVGGCPGGWYSIHPRGFVCVGAGVTLDLKHPTLAAMGLAPKLNEPLPYPYAEARVGTEIFVPNNEPEASVHAVARLRPAATFAVVGSWQAMDENDQRLRLALMTRGTFVRIDDLRAVETRGSNGVRLDTGQYALPLAFVIAERAKSWRLDGEQAIAAKSLARGTTWHIGSRPRLLGTVRYYQLDDGSWLQDSDVAVIRLRNEWPAFATGGKRWVDLDLQGGIIVLYAGQQATFAALTLAGPKPGTAKYAGETDVTAKYVTDMQPDPRSVDNRVYDVPWVIELRNGLRLHAGLGQERAGATAQKTAFVELAPPDAQQVWTWTAPTLPPGWHGIAASDSAEQRTRVLVR